MVKRWTWLTLLIRSLGLAGLGRGGSVGVIRSHFQLDDNSMNTSSYPRALILSNNRTLRSASVIIDTTQTFDLTMRTIRQLTQKDPTRLRSEVFLEVVPSVPLTGFEPATSISVKNALCPLSYRGTRER